MSIATKPTTRLVVDGIWGDKSEDACSWWMNIDQSYTPNSASSVKGIFTISKTGSPPSIGWQKVQQWLNKHRAATWGKMRVAGSTYYPWFGNALTVDGAYGVKTEAALGAMIVYLSAGDIATWASWDMSDYEWAARNFRCIQTLLNGVIFRDKPKGAGMYDDSGTANGVRKSSGYTWAKVPPARYL